MCELYRRYSISKIHCRYNFLASNRILLFGDVLGFTDFLLDMRLCEKINRSNKHGFSTIAAN